MASDFIIEIDVINP